MGLDLALPGRRESQVGSSVELELLIKVLLDSGWWVGSDS